MIPMKDFGDGRKMACEVALSPLRNTSAAPGDEDILWKSGVGILDLDVGKLNAAFVKVLDQLGEFALCIAKLGVSIPSKPKQCRDGRIGELLCYLLWSGP
jgi:hypothetical protein